MAKEIITRICERCGREVQVPAELTEFSCVYCGVKQRCREAGTTMLPADESDRVFAEAHLLDCVRDFPNYYKQFTRKKYEASYFKHLETIRPTFEAMDRYICAQPQKREALLSSFADSFVEQWEAYHRNHPKARTKHARERLAFANKLTLAWYTIPAIRYLGLSISEDFPVILQTKFISRYPDNPFEPAAYKDIQSGFRKRGLAGLFSKT